MTPIIRKIKKTLIVLLFIFGATLVSSSQAQSPQGESPISKTDDNLKKAKPIYKEQIRFFENQRYSVPAKFEYLPVGDINPKGWILDIMKQDISSGFVASLDELAPDLMKGDDLFNTSRRKSLKDIPDVGDQILTGADWEVSMQWWAGESLGNWWDGYVRNSFLTKDKTAIENSKIIVDKILSSQDNDGYIGIYSKAMRYKHEGSNGELWTQTTVFRMLLAYYELTKEKKVLTAVERAMAVTMNNYNEKAKSVMLILIMVE
jgi:hypothetical protein